MTCRLFTTYYRDPRPLRSIELDYCLAANAAVFDELYVLAEGPLPRTTPGTWQTASGRQTYRQVLEWANSVIASPEDITAIANCDVLIPCRALAQAAERLGADDAWCLSRWDVCEGGGAKLWDVEYSQDVWLFRGPIRTLSAEYRFGVPGCDNRFAHELQQAGYCVLNPSRSVKTFHFHLSGKRTPTNVRTCRVPPPYLFLKPTEL